MNGINELRAEINRFFNPSLRTDDERETIVSLSGRYQVTWDVYRLDDATRNWSVSDVIVTDLLDSTEVARFIRSDDRFWSCWIEREEAEYLVCSEALDGQTVIDLTHRQMASWCGSDRENGFIWVEYFPSPTGQRLAVIGCYWACPYEVVVYDFTSPMNLPLTELARADVQPDTKVIWQSDAFIAYRSPSGDEMTLPIE